MSTSITIDSSTRTLGDFVTALKGTWAGRTKGGLTIARLGRLTIFHGVFSAGTKSVEVPSSSNRYPVWFGNPSAGTIPAVVEVGNAFVYVPTAVAESGDSFCAAGFVCEDVS